MVKIEEGLFLKQREGCGRLGAGREIQYAGEPKVYEAITFLDTRKDCEGFGGSVARAGPVGSYACLRADTPSSVFPSLRNVNVRA